MASAMSTPPTSDPRRSTSSQPSATSSATLHSRHSAIPHIEHGESSSGKRRKVSSQTDRTRTSRDESAQSSSQAQELLGADLAAEPDHERRRSRPRRSGGFLLSSVFPRDTARRLSAHSDDKGRLTIPKRRKSKSPGSYEGSRRDYSGASSARSFHSRQGEGDALAAYERQASHDQRGLEGRFQGHAGLGIDVNTTNAGDGQIGQGVAPVMAGFDPAQIVHMALNLSESRRRQLSIGQLVAPPMTAGSRVASGTMPLTGTPMQGSYHDATIGSSLKQHLQQQRHASRNIASSGGLSTPASRHVSMSSPHTLADPGIGSAHSYQFSAATLARAARARAFIELSIEYRRLLQFLQPLRPNTEAAGNYTYTTTSVPGTSNFDLKPTNSFNGHRHQLGRSYNLLQFIRNRKLRIRERRQLDPDVREFEDTERVKAWIDAVEEASGSGGYRWEDNVQLPPFKSGVSAAVGSEQHSGQNRPSSLLLGKAKRPRMDWFTLPTELLADAVWLEQDAHKTLIEDRHGNKIFPLPRSSSVQPRMSRDLPRRSMDRRRLSTGGSDAAPPSEAHTVDSSDNGSHRGRKRLGLFHSHRDDSTDRSKKHGWMSRGRSSSSSDLSSSDDDMSTRRRKLDRRLTEQDENIGPLERHMKVMLEHDAMEEENQLSPILSSPDKWGNGSARNITVRRIRSESDRDGDSDRGQARHNRRVSRLSDKAFAQPRPSMEGLDSSAPNTPLSNTFSFGASSPPSRLASPDRKSRRSKFPFFRSEDSHKGQKVDTTDFAVEQASVGSSRQPSGEPAEPGRLSIDQPRSNPIVHFPLRSHRTNDSLSSFASIQERKEDQTSKVRKQSKEPKEPSSAVSRFFKDVRKEGSKVGEFIFKKDRPPEEADERASSSESEASSPSDTDDDMSTSVIKARPKPAKRITTETTASESSDGGRKPKYYMDLPAFKSTSTQEQEQDSDAALSGLEDLKRGRRSPRFDHLAPPRLDLSTVSPTSSPPPELTQEVDNTHLAPDRGRHLSVTPESRSRSPSAVRARMNKLLEVPGAVGRSGPPMTSLARIKVSDSDSPAPGRRSGDTSRSQSPPSGRHRHWSISDQGPRRPSAPNVTIAVTPADIARVRALLLCSGIKAKEICRRAHETRDTPPAFLRRAAETANAHLVKVPRKEEHVLAARILSSELENASQSFVAAAEDFRGERVRDLHRQCEELRITVAEKLTPRVHGCADDADAFTRELTSGATLAVKAVVDRVDMMGRARRRRMRWVRRVGWMLLEWTVLGLMWWVWLVVVVIKLILGVLRGTWKSVRWFLWLD